MAAEDLEEELRGLQVGEERRGSFASQANDCCLDAVAQQLFTMEAACRKNYSEDSRSQPHLHTCQEEKKEERMSQSKGSQPPKGSTSARWAQ